MAYRVELDDDLAEKITIAWCHSHLKMHVDMLHNHKHNGEYMHEEDVKYSKKLVKAFNKLLDYCGA